MTVSGGAARTAEPRAPLTGIASSFGPRRHPNLHVAAPADGEVRCWSETSGEEWARVGLWAG